MHIEYRILEKADDGNSEVFAVAFRRENRIWLFAPGWRAPQPLSASGLKQLSQEHFPDASGTYRWEQVIHLTQTEVHHPIQIFREAISRRVCNHLAPEDCNTEIAPGQEIRSLLSSRGSIVFKRHSDCLGNALRSMAGYFHEDRDRRSKFRKLIGTILNSDDYRACQIDLILLANKFNFPTWAVQCLPSLHFALPMSSNGHKTILLVWQQIAAVMPKSVNIEIKEKLCGGEILVVAVEKAAANLLQRIATRVEPHRLDNPFPSDSSVKGVVAEALDSIQKEDPEIAETVEEAQKNVLIEAGVGFAHDPR